MAALSTLQKLFKNSQSPSRILASLHNPYLLHSPNPSQTHRPNNENHTISVTPFLSSYKDTSFTHFDSLPFTSIHPFGLCSNPILATGMIQDMQNNDDSGMWADSVKKKRKKKMNKHKYKKLRKRLRKQT